MRALHIGHLVKATTLHAQEGVCLKDHVNTSDSSNAQSHKRTVQSTRQKQCDTEQRWHAILLVSSPDFPKSG